MNRIVRLLQIGILSTLFSIAACKHEPVIIGQQVQYTEFNKLKITDIHSKGWIKEFLKRQKSGLTGNIEVAGYPFNTCLWACEKMKGSTKAWWPYEQTAYYIDGVHRLGLLLNDKELIEKADLNTRYVMNHLDSSGRIGTNLADRWWRWPYASFLRNYMLDYPLSGDMAIVNALQKHYLTFTEKDFCDDLELANVEEICWLYGITKEERLIQMAEKAYQLFNANIENRNRAGADMQFVSDRIPDHHAVVYLELVKIPAILYSHTGKQKYLEDALNGIQKMEKNHMLISGLPSSTEHFAGQSELSGIETCNAAVLPYTYGYLLQITGDANFGDKIEKAVFNAGIGAVTKDFKAHQYFSSPNQFITTQNSNPYGHNPARMAWLPGHDVECCTGNVNRFMPYYAEQMWLGAPENGLVAALYGASSVNATVGENNIPVTISAETNYPFSENIDFKIKTKEAVNFPFYFRIPAWCESPVILVNGNAVKEKIQSGSFFKLEKTFSDGDIINLQLPMEIKVREWANTGIVVERGPLVFSYPISDKRNIIKNYEKSTAEFPGWELKPDADWNYALNLSNNIAGEIEVIQNPINGFPWELEHTPIKLKVPANKIINWALEKAFDEHWKMEVVRTPAFPEKIITSKKTEYIELVPYGATMLRLTVFPPITG